MVLFKMLGILLLLLTCVIFIACAGIPFFLTNTRLNLRLNSIIEPNSVEPCSNLYKYACSKWKAENTKPDFELSWNHFTAASYQIKKKVQHILESPHQDDSFLFNDARRFYNACLYFEEHKDKYLSDLRTLVDYFKGWPITDPNWSISEYNWLEEVALITKKLGVHPLIKFNVGIDYKNTNKYVLYIEPGTLVFPENVLLNPSEFATELLAYEEWITQSIQYLFPKQSSTKLKGEVQKIIDFERKLAKLMTIKSKMERTTLKRFTKEFGVHFIKIFKMLFPKLKGENIAPDTIAIKNYGYFKNLMIFMKRISNKKVANYLIWTLVKEFSRDTSVYLKKLNFSMDRRVLGITSDISRGIECTNKATDYFSFAILPKYIDMYHKNDVVTPIKQIAENIKAEYVNLLIENTWLSNETRILAIDKVKNIQFIVGYSEWMINKTEVEQYYQLSMTNDHFKNLILVKQLKNEKNLLLLGKRVKTPLWPSNIFDVNAYYSILQNLVFVPLGILQEPFYHENGPRIFNYGAIGSLIGHEFSHSLDTTGRRANSNGKIVKWWPNEDISGYQRKSECFDSRQQTTNVLLIGENIADNVGLDISYRAFKKLKNVEPDDFFWHFENDKVFFLSYAQMWCETSDPLDLFNDEHTSVEVRVNQAVSNNHEFNEIFSCTENQSKNSICKLW